MAKADKKNIYIMIIISALLIVAYSCRFGSGSGYAKEVGLIRSAIYLALFIVWAFSLYERIIQTQVRRYLTAIASLTVLWFLLRTLKYHFISGELYPNVTRYLWYLYYLPMLFIPLLAVFVAMSIGKPEQYRLPAKAMLPGIPTAGLFLLVLTNDLHQLVFTFPEEAVVFSDDEYGYSFGYYLVVAWVFVCALMMLYELYRKRRIPDMRRLILIPCIPGCLLIIYMVLYFLQVKWMRFLFGDMTVIMCLAYAVTLEGAIWCGFIQANTHYRELFDASTVGAQITDEAYQILLSSGTAGNIDTEMLRRTELGPVMLSGGLRLSGAPIRVGHVVWTEDMSALIRVLDELKEAKENLEDSNDILEEENAVKAREAHIAEQERLYNIIQRDTARQIRLMDELIEQVEEADTDESRISLLGRMLVVGAYLKRRSNLVFLADRTAILDAGELNLTFGESLDNLELCGTACGFCSRLQGPVLAVHMMSMYDFFETVTERSLGCMHSMIVSAGETSEGPCLIINTDSSANLTDLASDTVTVCRDEDGEWKLTLCLSRGGDNT